MSHRKHTMNVTRQFNAGEQAIFKYSDDAAAPPDYAAHSGQVITILAVRANAPIEGLSERRYDIRATDGWLGNAWESELHALQRE